jgi:DNA repair exonuclease SbcCD ATPase subunit
MRTQEKRLGDAEHLNRSLLVRCKSVEALATELTSELQKERSELTNIMRRKEGADSSMDASAELNGYLQGRLASARRREESVEEDMAALRTAVEAASSVQVRCSSQPRHTCLPALAHAFDSVCGWFEHARCLTPDDLACKSDNSVTGNTGGRPC